MAEVTPITIAPSVNLADYYLFDRLSEGLGEKVALRYGERSWTYQEVADQSLRVAQAFLAENLHVGARVYIVLPDTPPFAWTIFGTLKSGGVVCMGNPDAPADDLAYVIGYIGARILVTTPKVAKALAERNALPSVVFLVPDTMTGEDPEGPVEEVENCYPLASAFGIAELPVTARDDHAIWLFTSGSTGRSKAAMHTHRDFVFNTELYAKGTVGYQRDDITVSVPRLFFGYATGTNLFFPFAVGATVGLYSERPTPENLAHAITRYHPTIITNVPTMLGKLLDLDEVRQKEGLPGLDFSTVRFQLSAGEALPAALLNRFRAHFGTGEIYDGIGSAEMFHIYATNRPGDIRPGSLGKAVSGYTLKILPEEAEGPGAPALPPNEIGVLWVKGDSVAMGYHRDRDKSWQTFHGHWCRTGDLFCIDADGYLYFSGRADDLLKVGGQWVAPLEVEACLLEHPGVAIAAVVEGKDEEGLIKPYAFVVLRPGLDGEGMEAALQAHVKSRLSKHKYPRWIEILGDLPKNDRGKVDKKQLKAIALGKAHA